MARENMKPIYRILFYVMCLLPGIAGAAPVATTAGSNLTAYNPNSMGAINNNQWNSMMNSRSGTDSAPSADFGNCNALIMRCAQPKCATGGCTSMDVTVPIVNGCVNSNSACKQYGNDLVQAIAAQIVANSNAKASQAAQNAAASAAAQTSQQMAQLQQQMNMQMQQMQAQMQAQNDATVAQLQAALEEQKQMTAAAQQQVADAQIAQNAQAASGLTAAQEDAAARGVDSDLIVREQIAGEIMSKLENAETALKTLRDTMRDSFEYAGCDERGNNCTGPKRVKMFKQKAMGFFDPYNDVLDELYDSLITAQAVGVDITDIYMMLNGSCNVWGEYLCSQKDLGKYKNTNCVNGKSKAGDGARGGAPCVDGQAIGPEDSVHCTLNRTLADMEEVQRNWLEPEEGETSKVSVRVGCASSALESSALFRNRKKQASIDIETLEKMMSQDAPNVISKYRRNANAEDDMFERLKYCAVGSNQYSNLEKWVATKKLPNNVCVSSTQALRQVQDDGVLTASAERMIIRSEATEDYNECIKEHNICANAIEIKGSITSGVFGSDEDACCAPVEAMVCLSGYAGGQSYNGKVCRCESGKFYYTELAKCMKPEEYCKTKKQMPKSIAKNEGCFDSCLTYCTTDGSGQGGNGKACADKDKCEAKWNKDQDKCECSVKD
ncbi:MAG: hypothetical protein E7009_03330 [Alphaproteobacteria bacterium]|nr:hypothetical protein [Alphaproteobacteria bacterium]